MARKKPSKPNAPSPDIAGSSTPSPHTTSTPPRNIASTPTPTNTTVSSTSRNIATSRASIPTNTTPQNIATSQTSIPTNTTPQNIATSQASTPTNTTPRNITTPRALTPTNTTTSSTPQNIASTLTLLNTNITAPFRLIVLQDILASLNNLQDRVCRVEEENSLLQQFNEIFSDESNQLCEENKTLQEELQQLKQLCTPRKTINSLQQYSSKRPNKRLKLREKSPDEVAASAAKNLLKGQIPEEYWLDYSKTFSEQIAKIYEKLIPKLKRLMSEHYNPSKKNRRIKAAIKLYERNDANIKEFDKDELLSMLVQNDCHSIEQSDSEDDSRQKLPDNKQFLHVYDWSWYSDELKQLLRDVLDPEAEYI
ncbi:hypothetical protein RclHR1_17840003 [Rhizophagus clarus]|uniref:Uncharacterized protein n=1 Tax=Rhizophagus clarus TaxID=94130 RepID=A0A2Z6RDU4_9GLOM|nr:hypothetical protein RclHR1_17840003 [Rhizophagus clarus]